MDQYKALLTSIPELNAHLGTLGVDVKTPELPDEDSEEEAKPKKRVRAKKEKANIEATSDEEEE